MKNLTTVAYYLFFITTFSSFTYSASNGNTFFSTNSAFSSISKPNDFEYRLFLPSIILPETIDHIDEKDTSIFDEEEEVISIYLDDEEILSIKSDEADSIHDVSYISSPTNSIESVRSNTSSSSPFSFASLSSLSYSPSPKPCFLYKKTPSTITEPQTFFCCDFFYLSPDFFK